MSMETPKWQTEFRLFFSLNHLLVLTDNISDQCMLLDSGSGSLRGLLSLEGYLVHMLRSAGYPRIALYDPVRGFSDGGGTEDTVQVLKHLLDDEQRQAGRDGDAPQGHLHTRGERKALQVDSFRDAAEAAYLLGTEPEKPSAIVIRFASRLLSRPDDLDMDERMTFLYLRQFIDEAGTGKVASGQGQQMLTSRIILLTDKLNDLPAWFYVGVPKLKVIQITRPNYRLREQYIREMGSYIPGYADMEETERQGFLDRFVGLSEGFTLTDLNHVIRIMGQYRLKAGRVEQAVMFYRHGVTENPWLSLDAEKIRNAEEILQRRVLGQDRAVRRAVDIIKRTVSGMSGLQHSSSGKPRGILFLAGPTGTGKTELAKAITELIFRDERNMIRFDMSEYRQSQSDQRLLGAPPGYVGYEAGGQLTNAVREHPFSVLLFDEIEKAHPSLLDKFLQILEDGRITDGRGETVYFQDCFIIFTSNLGISVASDTVPGTRVQQVTYEEDHGHPEQLEQKVLAGIRHYFHEEIGRPELLNRIGDNILVFNYIEEEAGRKILDKQLDGICRKLLADRQITLKIAGEAHRELYALVVENLPKAEGGRGIGNVVETNLINPLSRYVFDQDVQAGETLCLEGVYLRDGVGEIRIHKE